MPENDEYAAGAAHRNAAYRKAYAEWVDTLPPDKREELRLKGLLTPLTDGSAWAPPAERDPDREDDHADRIDTLAVEEFNLPLEPGDEGYTPEGSAEPAPSPLRLRALRDFLCARGDPQCAWAALRYLLGFGTCESHARALGLTKQAFGYHVRCIQEALHLPPLGNQKSAKARRKYALANRRKLQRVFDTPPNA